MPVFSYKALNEAGTAEAGVIDADTPRDARSKLKSRRLHVTAIESLVAEARKRGVFSVIDGAHTPGHIPLDLEAIGADFYSGNCHKWLCAPKSAGFLYCAPEHRAELRPLVISHGASAPLHDRPRTWLEFDWVGSEDPSPYLTVPRALEFLRGALAGGVSALREHNQTLALEARRLLISRVGATPSGPESMVGAMATLTLSDGTGSTAERLYYALLEQHRIQVPVFTLPGQDQISLRVSAQIYNSLEDYQRLASALESMAGH